MSITDPYLLTTQLTYSYNIATLGQTDIGRYEIVKWTDTDYGK